MKKVALIFIFYFILIPVLYPQITGFIYDKKTKLPIPFATVSYEVNSCSKGTVADMQGKFTIDDNRAASITASCMGYDSQTISLTDINSYPVTIELEEKSFSLNELIVTPENNPALRIIRNVIANKKNNNFEEYQKYSYRSYFKVIQDLKLPATASPADSLKLVDILSRQTVMLISETVTDHHKSGKHEENKIVATRTSGFETSIFGEASYNLFHKAISFYNNSVSIFSDAGSMDKVLSSYLSPLCSSCLSSYNYQLESEYVADNDTVFEIRYFPKKNKNFNALTGTLFVHSGDFAIVNIIASPSDKGMIDFRFKQTYERVGGKWFPAELEEEIAFTKMRIDSLLNAYPALFITSRVDNISYNIQDDKSQNRLEKVYLDEISIKKSDSILNATRPAELTVREKQSYVKIDSISKVYKMEPIVIALATKADEGKIAFRKIDVGITNALTFNRYEKTRLGIGLYANENLIRNFTFGGYGGYGFKDKQWKYGAELSFINNKKNFIAKYFFDNTLKEAGRALSTRNDSYNSYLRAWMGSRYDHIIRHSLDLQYHIVSSLKIGVSFNLNEYTPMYDYLYKGMETGKYRADDITLSVRYAPGEKYGQLAGRRMLIQRGNPVIGLTYTKGISFINSGSVDYNKIELAADVNLFHSKVGQSFLTLKGGYIDRSAPYGLMFTGEGSRNRDVSLLIRNSFQTMKPYEFLSDKYVHLFYRHNFGSLLLKTKYFSPELMIAYNAGWGSLDNPGDYTLDFKIQDKFYLEGGLIIDKILKLNYLNVFYLNLGAGVFVRHGHYQLDKTIDNMAFKVSFSLSFK